MAALAGADGVRDVLRWALVPAGAALAGYTAFLFGQCEGRDLWQSPLLLPHTITNALVAGAGSLGIAALVVDAPDAPVRALGWTLAVAAALSLAIAVRTRGGAIRRGRPSARRRTSAATSTPGGSSPGWCSASRCPALLAAAVPRRRRNGTARGSRAPRRWSGCGSTRTPGSARARACRSARGRPCRCETIRPRTARAGASWPRSPPPERWDDWREYDPAAWPRKVERSYMLVPTVCFNCEAACGLLAYVDKETLEVRKLEGNPTHPGSRGRNCAKGPATINQIHDPERILLPAAAQAGTPRGGGEWERVSWDHVLDTFAERMHEAFAAGRPNDVMYFVGRPGEDGFADRFLETWGSDGHNSHTNVCSAGGAHRLRAVDGHRPARRPTTPTRSSRC